LCLCLRIPAHTEPPDASEQSSAPPVLPRRIRPGARVHFRIETLTVSTDIALSPITPRSRRASEPATGAPQALADATPARATAAVSSTDGRDRKPVNVVD